ncbi:MAG: O-antigen ligase family protein [Paracoccaceae bacterium]
MSPIPLASNHPVAWMFWATILGWYAAVIHVSRPAYAPLTATPAGLVVLIGSLLSAFAVYQALPLPALRGGISVQSPVGILVLPSLSIAPTATFLAAIRLTSYIIFFTLALKVPRLPGRAEKVGSVILFGIAAHALFAILTLKFFNDTNFITDKSAFLGKATGTFINKNSFATFLGMGVILGLSLITGKPGQTTNRPTYSIHVYWHIAIGIIAFALILTQSRMGIAATLVAATMVLQPRALQTLALCGAAFSALGIALLIFGLGVPESFFDVQASAETRIALYRQIFGMIADRPLTGFGLDSFSLAYELYHSPPVTAEFVWDRGHSIYLTLWVEYGVILGSAPIVAGIILARELRRLARQQSSPRAMARAGYAALVLCALHSLVDFSLEIQANTFLLITLVALGLGPTAPPKEQN